jgi:DNA modification methylase
LIEPCVLAGSRPGDVVLDPFMGAGTTAVVAQRLGRHYVGCELKPEYAAIAEARIRAVQPGLGF